MIFQDKRLPRGFTYILSKKDCVSLDNEFENCILNVFCDGTSYSETKMAKNYHKSKTVITLTPTIDSENLFFYITLSGIRKEHFKDVSEFSKVKEDIINNLKQTIQNLKSELKNNNVKTDRIYFRVDT